MTATVRWPAIHAEQLNGLELLAPPFLSREKVEKTETSNKTSTKDENFLNHLITNLFACEAWKPVQNL